MFAVKSVNLLVADKTEHFQPANGYVDACQIMRQIEADSAWIKGVDYELEIVEVDDDFDFDNQPEWN